MSEILANAHYKFPDFPEMSYMFALSDKQPRQITLFHYYINSIMIHEHNCSYFWSIKQQMFGILYLIQNKWLRRLKVQALMYNVEKITSKWTEYILGLASEIRRAQCLVFFTDNLQSCCS